MVSDSPDVTGAAESAAAIRAEVLVEQKKKNQTSALGLEASMAKQDLGEPSTSAMEIGTVLPPVDEEDTPAGVA